jgi:hypothetical protein
MPRFKILPGHIRAGYLSGDVERTILFRLRPDFGAFDYDASSKWATLRCGIRDWLAAGTWHDAPTIDSVVREARVQFSEQLDRVTR